MVGCTIGGSSPVDVSGQSRDTDLPVGQVGWKLSLREEEENNVKPNSTEHMLAMPSPSKNISATLVTIASTTQMQKTTEHMLSTNNPPNQETLKREPNKLDVMENYTSQDGSPREPMVLSGKYVVNTSDVFPRLTSIGRSTYRNLCLCTSILAHSMLRVLVR